MSSSWNIFRYAGDISHLSSKAILMFSIHRNRSAEGVSLITQILYAVVFCTRYIDILYEPVRWNFFFKCFYITSSLYIIAIMQWVFPRTREREISWKIGTIILGGSLVLSPFVMLIFEKYWDFTQWLWDFSEVLESVCVLPQLVLLRQTSVPTVINSYYLATLGLYRFLYVLNWIWRGLDPNGRAPNAVSVIFGVIQIAFFIDFFWCYYTRPRVRLRNGGIVDAQDYQRGWFIGHIIGNNVRVETDEDEESAPTLGDDGHEQPGRSARPKWGSRGISVSADEDVFEREPLNRHDSDDLNEPIDPDAKMQDPDDLAKALDDEDEDSPLPGPYPGTNGEASGVRGGDEWRDA
ncbi:related to endoplasmic reticulum retention receptor [Cephalotrichum gorgonifer]|uniref:Related to endoplasmic reticulum retention receptor n=1 Tax=Cephalotrichum gorgonifer TaxID=2041049 RepID=A0AAE8T095_9PEZI|nr:related to endoplasmic reticulum retention receptor [Cephalotrichum gorgonifer]